MAKAIANCTCTRCGKDFEVIVTGFNRKDADSRAAWAAQHNDLCPDCYRAKKQAEAAEKAASYDLPEINAASEKQLGFAQSLREEYIAANSSRIEKVSKMLKRVNADVARKMAADAGTTVEAVLLNSMTQAGYEKEYIALTARDARTIIDTLK